MQDTMFERYVIAGGILMWTLVPLSILTLGFIIQCFIALRRSRIVPDGLIRAAKDISTPAEFAAFRQGLPSLSHPLARIVLDYLESAERGQPLDLDENPGPIDSGVDRLYHGISPLASIYTVAPLLGLLGTILGLMDTIFQFAVVQTSDLETLSRGMSNALITTMWGLGIAIPAYVFHSVLRHMIFRYEKDGLPQALVEVFQACQPYALSQIAPRSAKAHAREGAAQRGEGRIGKQPLQEESLPTDSAGSA